MRKLKAVLASSKDEKDKYQLVTQELQVELKKVEKDKEVQKLSLKILTASR